ncbi:centromere protein F-like [Mauremys mutica]|uniref:centromere protein F-like n=1 Tax=Mauremys mutica TaxID=74926 RepID=UPI001D1380C0|nr:centromere protein F-like [Mauremys mutica]
MEEKNLLCLQSEQQLQKIQQLEAELKTARDFLKESQNYAEEMKKKTLSQEIELKEKQAEITHLQLSAAELASLKKEMINIKAQQKTLKEQLNITLHENEQLSKVIKRKNESVARYLVHDREKGNYLK